MSIGIGGGSKHQQIAVGREASFRDAVFPRRRESRVAGVASVTLDSRLRRKTVTVAALNTHRIRRNRLRLRPRRKMPRIARPHHGNALRPEHRRKQPHRQIGPRHRDDLRRVRHSERIRSRRLQRSDRPRLGQPLPAKVEPADRPRPRRDPGRQVDPVRPAERSTRSLDPSAMRVEQGEVAGCHRVLNRSAGCRRRQRGRVGHIGRSSGIAYRARSRSGRTPRPGA